MGNKIIGNTFLLLFHFIHSVTRINSSTFLRLFENAISEQGISTVLRQGIEITNEIVAELLCTDSDLFREISLHDKQHKVIILKKIVFSFISIKGKHQCRTVNVEKNTLIRHKKTKEIIFRHE